MENTLKGGFILQFRLLVDPADAAIFVNVPHSIDSPSVEKEVLMFAQALAYQTTWVWSDDFVKICSDVILFRCIVACEVHDLAMEACNAVDRHNERDDKLFRLIGVRMGAAFGPIHSVNTDRSCFPSCNTVLRADHLEKVAPPFGLYVDLATFLHMPAKVGGRYGPPNTLTGINGERLTGHLILFRNSTENDAVEPFTVPASPAIVAGDGTLSLSSQVASAKVVNGQIVGTDVAFIYNQQKTETVTKRIFDLIHGNAMWEAVKLMIGPSTVASLVAIATGKWWACPAGIFCLAIMIWSAKSKKR